MIAEPLRRKGLGLQAVRNRIGQREVLSLLFTLAMLFIFIDQSVSTFGSQRAVVNGYTVQEEVTQSSVRFVVFGLAMVFLLVSLGANLTVRTREALLVAVLLISQFACDRTQDFTLGFSWAVAILMVFTIAYRVPLNGKIFSLLGWAFVISHFLATALKPTWAIFHYPDVEGFNYRLAAATIDPNQLGFRAGFLALVVGLYVRTRGWQILFSLLIALLVLSVSKTSIICIVIAWIWYKRNWKIPPILAILIPIVSIGYAFLAAANDSVRQSVSLTGRANLWRVLVHGVEQSPIIGYGADGVEEVSKFGNYGFRAGNHAHDAALQVLVQGGAVAFTLYLVLLYLVASSANRSRLGAALLIYFLIHAITETTLPWGFEYLICFSAFFTAPIESNRAGPTY
jgi:O-Antigen ligase